MRSESTHSRPNQTVRCARTGTGPTLLASTALALTLVAAPCRAEEASGIGEQLFLEGKELMKQGKVELACEKFQASHDADASATGTLLNLALCNEQIGKYASAWAEFRQVAAESTGRRDDRVALAHEHEAKLYPMLSYLTVVVPNEARAPELRVVLDKNRAITEAMWSTKLPVDAGKHEVVATAPGRQSRRYELTVATQDKVVNVQPLAALAPPKSTPLGGSATRRTVGYVLGGVGVAALGVGSTFGAIALMKSDRVKSACPNDHCPSTRDVAPYTTAASDASTAQTDAQIADVTLAAGAALLIAGAVLVWTGREQRTPAASTHLTVAPTSRGGAVLLGGAF